MEMCMIPLADVACAVLMSITPLTVPTSTLAGATGAGAFGVSAARLAGPVDSVRPLPRLSFELDTIRKPRAKAVTYSEGYGKRLTLHRRLSYAMLPLFAASFFSGDQILKKGSDAPSWARNLHRPAATGSAVLFTANTLTGAINSWQSRRDPIGRKRRIAHGLLFTAASAGFVYAGTKLADDAEESQDKRLQHRNVALGSMGVSTVSWLIMLLGN
jgi:hypothetical protein